MTKAEMNARARGLAPRTEGSGVETVEADAKPAKAPRAAAAPKAEAAADAPVAKKAPARKPAAKKTETAASSDEA